MQSQSSLKELSLEESLELCLEGNDQACELLTFYPQFQNTIERVIGKYQRQIYLYMDKEDLVVIISKHIAKKLKEGKFQIKSNTSNQIPVKDFLNWSYKVARNKIIDILRTRPKRTLNVDIDQFADLNVEDNSEALNMMKINELYTQDKSEYSEYEPLILKINPFLSSAFEKLPIETQGILILIYGLSFSQSEVASVFHLKQYKISRVISKTLKNLLKYILENIESITGIKKPINFEYTVERIEQLLDLLKDSLELYYQNYLYIFLESKLVEIFNNNEIYFSQPLAWILSEIKGTKMSENEGKKELEEKIKIIKQDLYKYFVDYLDKSLKVNLNSMKNAEDKINRFIERWLEQQHYSN